MKHGPLPGPENSAAFLAAYDRLHLAATKAAGAVAAADRWPPRSIGAAITAYMLKPEFTGLSDASKRQYRHHLDLLRGAFGQIPVADMHYAFVTEIRNNYAARPNAWNGMRSRMVLVVDEFMKHHPREMPANTWPQAGRMGTEDSRQNRPWPDEVIEAVMRAGTPEFRALVVTLLLTSQRVGDVTRFDEDQYDPIRQTLAYTQGKGDKPQVIHVPDALADAFAAMRGRVRAKCPKTGRWKALLPCSPRGKPWTVVNAEETTLRMRANLGLDRHCPHGLRAIAATSLKMLGFENRVIRSLTAHTSDKSLELYLRGVPGYALAKPAQEALADRFAPVFSEAARGANANKAAGATGKAAAAAGKSGDALKAAQAKRRAAREAAVEAEAERLRGGAV